jgi:Ala-tRNA(Pro) deacylase
MSVVTEHLERAGVKYEVLRHEPTATAEAEAHVLRISEDDVVKTVVLDLRTGHAFAVLPASCRIDLDKVRAAIDSRHVELASEDEIASDYPEFELGAVPPLGAMVRTPLIVDPAVLDHDEVVFAGGSQDESIRMRTSDLFASAMMRVADICGD